MKYIQSQINMHFLYNTLDLINWFCIAGNGKKAGEAIVALSNFYRISLNYGEDIITVSEASNMLFHYVHILELCYPNRYNINLIVDENISEFKVLKFIFQPLVENAFLHGVSKQGDSVTISFEKENDGVLFTVRDTGRGMSAETLNRIGDLSSESDSTTDENFAIKNIKSQVELFYGSDFGCKIDSVLGEGTVVRIFLPRCEG